MAGAQEQGLHILYHAVCSHRLTGKFKEQRRVFDSLVLFAGYILSRWSHPHLRSCGCDEPEQLVTATGVPLSYQLQLPHLESL